MTNQSDLIFDVGMHKGQDADFYLRKGFRVVGFEAEPTLAAHCRARFVEEIEAGKLTVIEGAIVEHAHNGESVKFYRNKCNDVWGTVHDTWAIRNESLGSPSDAIEVKAIDFTEYLRRYGIPHYLKIDIEGSDILCLKALRGFEQKPDFVSVESEKISFRKLKEEFCIFEELGYKSFKVVQQQGIPGMRAKVLDSDYQFEDGASGLFGEDLPGKWKNRQQVLMEYWVVFMLYDLYGDNGKLNSYRLGRKVRNALERVSGKQIPGWYDTHAKLGS